ncbi:hypothetical protein P4O66_021903, partial [Electrophorus voltai]
MSSSQQRTCNQSSIHLPVLSQLQPASSMLHGPSGSDMNRIYSAVSKVFQGKELQMNELYSLNESIRWLLKTEMGSFIKEYYQELTVRQMALLGFRDLVLMRLPVEDLLPTNLPLLPTSITQMLLVLQ